MPGRLGKVAARIGVDPCREMDRSGRKAAARINVFGGRTMTAGPVFRQSGDAAGSLHAAIDAALRDARAEGIDPAAAKAGASPPGDTASGGKAARAVNRTLPEIAGRVRMRERGLR